MIYFRPLHKSGIAVALLLLTCLSCAAQTTPQERRTDTLARTVLRLVNEHKADSIYTYAGQGFKSSVGEAAFLNFCKTGLFPDTPFPAAVFVSSRNGISKYRLGDDQFLLGLDKEGKFHTFAMQAYHEDAVKDYKALTDNPLKTGLDSTVDRLASAYIQTKGNVGLSIAVHHKGADHFYNYGETEQGNHQLPSRNTIYDIGSITKTFTATLLAMAVNEKKVTLQTPVTVWLPDSVATNPALKGITLVQLANHTSGLPRLADNTNEHAFSDRQPYASYNVSHLFTYLKSCKPARPPGTQYEYSNLGAALLGVLLERIYHQRYEQLLNARILKPTGMTETVMILTFASHARMATGYNEQLQPVPSWTFNAYQAAGGLKSTTADMLRYMKLQLKSGSTTLNKAVRLTHRVTWQENGQVVGLGWHYMDAKSHVVHHAGGTGGFRSLATADLDKGIAVVVLTNNATNGDELGINLIQALRKQ